MNIQPVPPRIRKFWKLLERETERPKKRLEPPTADPDGWAFWTERMHDDCAIAILEAVETAGVGWCEFSTNPFLFDTKPEWLERIGGIAGTLRDYLKPPQDWPIHFASDSLEVILTRERGLVQAWVGRNGAGVGIEFDPRSFEPRGAETAPAFRTAVGCAIAWYLDCALQRRSALDGIPTLVESSITSIAKRSWRPTADFSKRVAAVRSAQRSPCFAHWVTSHVRSLSDTSPDPDHVADAPEHLIRRMGPDDTWVTGHLRSGDNLENLLRRLEDTSILADALGTSKWLTPYSASFWV